MRQLNQVMVALAVALGASVALASPPAFPFESELVGFDDGKVALIPGLGLVGKNGTKVVVVGKDGDAAFRVRLQGGKAEGSVPAMHIAGTGASSDDAGARLMRYGRKVLVGLVAEDDVLAVDAMPWGSGAYQLHVRIRAKEGFTDDQARDEILRLFAQVGDTVFSERAGSEVALFMMQAMMPRHIAGEKKEIQVAKLVLKRSALKQGERLGEKSPNQVFDFLRQRGEMKFHPSFRKGGR